MLVSSSEKVKVGNDQQMAQSERNSHSKTEVGKYYIDNKGLYCQPSEKLFSNMKRHISHKQLNIYNTKI